MAYNRYVCFISGRNYSVHITLCTYFDRGWFLRQPRQQIFCPFEILGLDILSAAGKVLWMLWKYAFALSLSCHVSTAALINAGRAATGVCLVQVLVGVSGEKQ